MSDDQVRTGLRRREFTIFSGVSLSTALSGCAGMLDSGGTESNGETTDESELTDREQQSTGGEISSFKVTPESPQQGQEITITTTILNNADVNHTGTVDISIGSESVFEDQVTLQAGKRETLTTSTERWQTGTHDATAALSANGETLDSAESSVNVTPVHSQFVGVSGTDFVIDGESVYYSGGHSGGNLHSRTSSDDEDGFEYEFEDDFDGDHYVADFMQYAASIGVNVNRVTCSAVPWAENSTVHDAPGEFNEAWFELFDTIVAEAKRNNVRLVVSLLAHGDGPAPNPAAYASWSDTVDDDLKFDALNDAFFNDEQAKEYYKNFIEKLLTRENPLTGVEYRNDPTIMMWECGNEIEYRVWDDRGKSLAEWYDEIATYIKSLDENHLVGSGMFGSDERNEFVEDHRSDAIDVCSFHLYPKFPAGPDSGDSYDEEPTTDMTISETTAYIEEKVETAHSELGKPVMLGEYGVPQFPDLYGWTLETRREFFDAMYETADRVDLNGVHAFALTLDKKFTGETRITDGRAENGIYPDDELPSIIGNYGDVVRINQSRA